MTVPDYLALRKRVEESEFGDDITWSENLKPPVDAIAFWIEFAWVVINSGMKFTVAQKIWAKVHPAVARGESAGTVFGHKGKCAAIADVWHERETFFEAYQAAVDKLEWLRSLPWIGDITKFHLAKNLGHDCAKPDRHLVRIAGQEGTHALCARLAKDTGDRIATVDVVIWRAAERGWV